LESLKKSITWIVEITDTIKYKHTNVPMMNQLTILSLLFTVLYSTFNFR
jgi:hypothetical protein